MWTKHTDSTNGSPYYVWRRGKGCQGEFSAMRFRVPNRIGKRKTVWRLSDWRSRECRDVGDFATLRKAKAFLSKEIVRTFITRSAWAGE